VIEKMHFFYFKQMLNSANQFTQTPTLAVIVSKAQ